MKASYDHGVLTIRFPKRGERRDVRQIPISAGGREKPPAEGKAGKDRAA